MDIDKELKTKKIADLIRSMSSIDLNSVSNNQIVEIAKICGFKPDFGKDITKKYHVATGKYKGNYILPIRHEND